VRLPQGYREQRPKRGVQRPKDQSKFDRMPLRHQEAKPVCDLLPAFEILILWRDQKMLDVDCCLVID
jgi:hypothetical protein